jgi:hypothetical protein
MTPSNRRALRNSKTGAARAQSAVANRAQESDHIDRKLR